MNKLDFLFVGPQKTATTWCYDSLIGHHQLSFPREFKESFFWDRYYDKGIEWYWNLFEKNDKLKIEVAPTYFHSYSAMQRISKVNGKVKIVITLRDPVQRSFSLYLHHLKKGRYNCGFWDAVKLYPEIIEASYYRKYVTEWINYFGKDNVSIILQEEIQKDPIGTISRICEFLTIDISFNEEMIGKRSNVASMPKNNLMANMSTRFSYILRSMGLYSFVNFAKNIGLKDFIYSSKIPLPKLDQDTEMKLTDIFKDDLDYLEEIKYINLKDLNNV